MSIPMEKTDVTQPAGLDLLEHRLQGQLGGRIRNLRLSIQDQGLVLRGNARTYYAKQVAQHAVMSQANIPIRLNAIEVA